MKKLIFLFAFLFPTIFSFAQDNYEIQVYGSETQEKHSTMFELHSNYTFEGEKNIVDGVLPTYHALRETLEITNGITDNFEIGFYLFTNYSKKYGYNVIGSHIRPRVMAPEKWKLPVGVSLSLEAGYQKPQYSNETWSLEVRPIIDKQWKRLYVAFNPTFGISLKSAYDNSVPAFEPNFKAAWSFLTNVSLGVEYYGQMGAISNFEMFSNQEHAVFAAVDILNSKNWEFNAGAGFGLTPATDGFIFKIIVGRRVFWKRKHQG